MKYLKGYHTLIEALPRVITAAGSDTQLVIYGGRNTYSSFLESRAEALGIRKHITLVGWLSRDEVALLISLANVGVVPSTGADALPRSVYEYMARGLPTIATRVGGAKEVIHDGHNGYLISPWNTFEISDKLTRLLNQTGLRDQMGALGYETIVAQFQVSQGVEQRIALYEQLLWAVR